MTAPTVRTVLGDERPATRFYGDGSFDCPFCHHPVVTPKTACENPWCDAYPSWDPAKLQERRAKLEAEAAEEARCKRNHEWALERIREQRIAHEQWQATQIAEARRRGACLECLFQAAWERAKFVRHRGECPTVRRRRSLYGQAAEAKRRGYP